MSPEPPPPSPASHPAEEGPGARRLVDFPALAGWLRIATGVLGALALAACVGDGLLHGLTFALMARWAAAFLVALAVVTAILVAVHAIGGASTARSRGERLGGDDIGLVPPRPPRRGTDERS